MGCDRDKNYPRIEVVKTVGKRGGEKISWRKGRVEWEMAMLAVISALLARRRAAQLACGFLRVADVRQWRR